MDLNARWVDQCEDTSLLNVWRGGFTVNAGRYRASAITTVEIATWNGETATADGYAEIVVETLSGTGSEVGLALRVQSGVAHYVAITTTSGTATIYSYDGSFHSLASTGIVVPTRPFTLRADINDTQIRFFLNGVQQLGVSDSTFSGPGAFGIYEYAATATTNVEISRWETGYWSNQGPVGRGTM